VEERFKKKKKKKKKKENKGGLGRRIRKVVIILVTITQGERRHKIREEGGAGWKKNDGRKVRRARPQEGRRGELVETRG